jgi:predicted lipase
LIVVSIQGTANIEELETDLDFPRVKTSLCGTANTNDGCEIHQGFWNALLDVQVTVKANVVSALKSNPGYKVISTGHSLGGAVGALVGTVLRNAGINVDIVRAPSHRHLLANWQSQYTYGQPKLGTVDISNYIQNQAPSKGSNYRVTHYNDIIPSLPPHLVEDWE